MKFFNLRKKYQTSSTLLEQTTQPQLQPVLLTGDKPWPVEEINWQLLEGWNAPPTLQGATDIIMGAAQNDQPVNMKICIRANIPLNVFSNQGFSILTLAAKTNATKVLARLINEYNFNPEYIDKHGYNVLHAAAAGGHFELALDLLNDLFSDRPVEAIATHKKSILQIAIEQLQFEFVNKWLAKFPDDISYVDEQQRTALLTALGCYVRVSFDDGVLAGHREKELEDFCRLLLKKEHAFQPPNGALPAISVLLHPQLGLELPRGTAVAASPGLDPTVIIARIRDNAPTLADELYKQAIENPAAKGADIFIKYYQTLDVSKNSVLTGIKNRALFNSTPTSLKK